jgi:hypothetical protein
MMTRDELLQWLSTELPKMLREDSMFRSQVIGVLSEVLVTKGEVTQILDELRAMRAESERRFEAVAARFEAMLDEMRTMRADFERRFEAVDARFEAVDARFEAMLDEMRTMRADFERRFEAVDARFEAVAARFEAMLDEMRTMRADFERRFEAVAARFEAVAARFEAMLDEMRTMRADFERRFEAVDRRFDAVENRLAGVEIGLGSLGLRMGRGLEDIIRQVIENYSGVGALKAERLTLVDEAGECLHPGATVEFDALVTNGRKFLVEVKNFAKPGDVSAFYRKARFAETKLEETFEKILIAPAATRSAVELAKQLGIICHTFSVGE